MQQSGKSNRLRHFTSVGWNIRLSRRKSPWTSVTSLSLAGKFFINQLDSSFMAGISLWADAMYCFVQVDTFRDRKGTFQKMFKTVTSSTDKTSLIYWLVFSHLSFAVAWSSAIPFKVQWHQLQWVQLCQHFHCSHIQSCSLCWTNSRETKIPEYTPLVNRKQKENRKTIVLLSMIFIAMWNSLVHQARIWHKASPFHFKLHLLSFYW